MFTYNSSMDENSAITSTLDQLERFESFLLLNVLQYGRQAQGPFEREQKYKQRAAVIIYRWVGEEIEAKEIGPPELLTTIRPRLISHADTVVEPAEQVKQQDYRIKSLHQLKMVCFAIQFPFSFISFLQLVYFSFPNCIIVFSFISCPFLFSSILFFYTLIPQAISSTASNANILGR